MTTRDTLVATISDALQRCDPQLSGAAERAERVADAVEDRFDIYERSLHPVASDVTLPFVAEAS